MQTVSEILASNVDFHLRRKASQFLKAREAVIKCGSPAALVDLKANAKALRLDIEWLIATCSQDFDADAVIENYVGLNRVWTANAEQIEKTAEDQGISIDQAREVLEVSLSQAQLYAQTTRGNLIGIYAGWLSDIDASGEVGYREQAHKELNEVVNAAYAKAGEWLRRDEGLLIEASASDWECVLPKWSEVLPKATESTANAKRKIERNMTARAEQLRDQYNQAMAEINNSDW